MPIVNIRVTVLVMKDKQHQASAYDYGWRTLASHFFKYVDKGFSIYYLIRSTAHYANLHGPWDDSRSCTCGSFFDDILILCCRTTVIWICSKLYNPSLRIYADLTMQYVSAIFPSLSVAQASFCPFRQHYRLLESVILTGGMQHAYMLKCSTINLIWHIIDIYLKALKR